LFNPGAFPNRGRIFVGPRINGGDRHGGGALIGPGRRH